jgi:hypothetical protein
MTAELRARTWLPMTVVTASIVIGLLVVVAPVAAATAASAVGLLVVLASRRGRLFLAYAGMAVVPVIAGIAVQAQGRNVGIRRIDDVFLVFGALLLVREFERWQPRTRFIAGMAMALLLGSELAGAIGAVGRPLVAVAAAWQDFRWLGAIGLGLGLGRYLSSSTRQLLALSLLAGWNLANLAVAGLQMTQGEASRAVLGIPQTNGLFGHPTHGAIAATALFVFLLCSKGLVTRLTGTIAATAALWILAGLNLLVSTRFKPILALAFVVAFLLTQSGTRRRVAFAVLFAFAPLAGAIALHVGDRLRAQPNPAIITQSASHSAPRVELIDGARRIAASNAPFGAGLGSFGSDLDPDTEDRTFTEAGLTVFGFVGEAPDFRADSQLAHVLAERGYAGLMLWLLGLAMALVAAIRISGRQLFLPAALVAAIALIPVNPSLHSGTDVLILLTPAALAAASVATDGSRGRGSGRQSTPLPGAAD